MSSTGLNLQLDITVTIRPIFRFVPNPRKRKAPITGAFFKRMMGLEPTTFCMASRVRSWSEAILRVNFW